MATDEKLDEVLKIVREQGKQLVSLIQEQGERHERRFNEIDGRFAEIDDRFTQLETRLNAKIDKVYEALSQDISVFAEDMYRVQDRVTRLEKKLLS
ncbi:MAG TPA: hypothetical protein VFX30_04105 [bacterium]|nr:hypothetical protein [bacterium]